MAGIAAASPAVNAHGGDITGAAPAAGIMALRALDASGQGWSSDIAAAFAWAAEHGARVVNASLTVDGPSQAIADAIAAHPNTLFVAAAGNGDDHGRGLDEDRLDATRRAHPCALDLANVLCVAAVDNRGDLAAFSNYGAQSVDVGAPGVDVVSYTVGGGLAWWDGTVDGRALCRRRRRAGRRPHAHADRAAAARRRSSGRPARCHALAGRTTSGGMIDASALLARTATLPVSPAPPPPRSSSPPRRPSRRPRRSRPRACARRPAHARDARRPPRARKAGRCARPRCA